MSKMPSNFDFLERLDRGLADFGREAESCFNSDPSMCHAKLLKFCKRLLQSHAVSSGVKFDDDDSQVDILKRLKNEHALPQYVIDIFEYIRKCEISAGGGGDSRVLTCLKMCVQIGAWHVRVSTTNREFQPKPFLPSENSTDSIIDHEQTFEQEYNEVNENVYVSQTSPPAPNKNKSDNEKNLTIKIAHNAAGLIDLNERETRQLIDHKLRSRGWEADSTDLKYSKGTRPVRGRCIAIAEWPTQSGYADYALFIDEVCVGIVEAKRYSKNVVSAINQAERYSKSFDWEKNSTPWKGGYLVPLVFATNGRPYLKQIETESGIWFRDIRSERNLRRPLIDWFTPEDVMSIMEVDLDKAHEELKTLPFDFGFQLRPYQKEAIEAVEDALANGKREILVAMATGTGKTKLSIGMLYRLLKTKRFRSICFVVDRSALGEQAATEFGSTAIDGTKSFGQLYEVMGLGNAKPNQETRVHICTVQSLVRRVFNSIESADSPSVGQYDLMIVDECHRGYLLDRESSSHEFTSREEEDYISKYRHVLEHFDAVKIGLTATPAIHTEDIFGKPVYRYGRREAVVDGWLVDHEPCIRFETVLSKFGIRFEKGMDVDFIDYNTGDTKRDAAPDILNFEVEDFNRKVITVNFNKAICKELVRHIDPTLDGKTLVFAVNNAHADIVVSELKKAFKDRYTSIDDAAVCKITWDVENHNDMIRSFRNDAFPKVAVTVDLLTTGVDLPEVTNLVFIRRVNSRILYEQMIGRATRRCDYIGKESFRVFDAVDIYATLQETTQMKPVAVNPQKTYESLINEYLTANADEQRRIVLDHILVKLHRKMHKPNANIRELIEKLTNEPVESLLNLLKRGDLEEIYRKKDKLYDVARMLDEKLEYLDRNWLPISHEEDSVTNVYRGYGKHKEPGDFLYEFEQFVNENKNRIVALKVIAQRPQDLTRKELRNLRLKLDRHGFSEANLRQAWSAASNEDIAASIVEFVRKAALGDPLTSFEERVHNATKEIISKGDWTHPQIAWLRRIANQIIRDVVVDRDSLDELSNFSAHGGFKRLDSVFDGRLESILSDFNDEIWRKYA